MLLLEAKLSRKSSRQVTKSMEGQDRIQRSDSKSLGPEERHEPSAFLVSSHEHFSANDICIVLTSSGHDGIDREAPAPAVD